MLNKILLNKWITELSYQVITLSPKRENQHLYSRPDLYYKGSVCGLRLKTEGKGPISISPHLFCSHHANWLALEEVGDELGNEGAVDKKRSDKLGLFSLL